MEGNGGCVGWVLRFGVGAEGWMGWAKVPGESVKERGRQISVLRGAIQIAMELIRRLITFSDGFQVSEIIS